MHVLLVKTSSMGDLIHTLPAVTDAAQMIPDLQLDWVVEEDFVSIPTWHPAVNRVIPVAIRRWRKDLFSSTSYREYRLFCQQLRQQQYDAVIDAQGLLKSVVLVACAAQGKRHGYNCNSAREPLASLFYHSRHPVSKKEHAVERIRQLFSLSLHYPLPITLGNYAIADAFIPSPPSSPYLVFLHATTRDKKHWPIDHWRALITLLADLKITIKLPWGTHEEHQRAQQIAHNFSHVDVLAKKSLNEMASILAGATAVVSVDTGLSHLTAALGRPNITLFGPTDPKLVGGYGQQQWVITSTDKQMASILPQQVFQQLKPLIML